MIVVADTSPLNYLILIDQIDLLRTLYGQVFIPPAVVEELTHPRTPEQVRSWIAQPVPWLEVRAPRSIPADFPTQLGPGECEAIALGQELNADALLLDEWERRAEAERRHLTVVGTLRVLGDAAEHELIDLPQTLALLRKTNFRVSDHLFEQVLSRHTYRQLKQAEKQTGPKD